MASTRYLVLRYRQLRDRMIAHQWTACAPVFTAKENDELNRVYSALYARTNGFRDGQVQLQ